MSEKDFVMGPIDVVEGLKAGCGDCGELFDDPLELIAHMLESGHCLSEELMDQGIPAEAQAELAEKLRAVMSDPDLPSETH